ncbi:MAG: DNA polymerase Y family protein [Candidatus Dormibacteraeota bacterium]|nr:DNA polymerase Y family protein [Candidatus Dormibacteraeota bacterium]
MVAAWRETVVCASEQAVEAGVRSGMSQRQAQQLCPDAEFLAPDPTGAARLAERIAAALYDLSPVVEVRVEGVVWIDLGGVSQRTLALREMRRRLRSATGVEPRLGLGPGPFCAQVAAKQARPGRLLEVNEARTFLAPLPVGELGLEPWQAERLELLGLRTLGDVSRIGPRQLESQLGRDGRTAARRARGEEPDQLQPWLPPRSTSARRQFEPPIEDREALLFVGRALCSDLAAEIGLRGAGAKRVRVRLDTEERVSLVRNPLTSTAELFGLVGAWLREWQPRDPVAEMEIELPLLEPAGRRQLRLWVHGDGSGEEVKAALERLQERHGMGIATHPEPILPASPIPSQRFRWDPIGLAVGTPAAGPMPHRDLPAPLTSPSLSRNLGDFDCSPRLAKVATLNRTATAVTLHADDLHGIKATRRR